MLLGDSSAPRASALFLATMGRTDAERRLGAYATSHRYLPALLMMDTNGYDDTPLSSMYDGGRH
jgi:hypothetical protein